MLSVFCVVARCSSFSFFFFFNDTATTEIYTLSLHDALPISRGAGGGSSLRRPPQRRRGAGQGNSSGSRRQGQTRDRKSTRLNSSHGYISYAVFCLKKKKRKTYKHNTMCYTTMILITD